MADYIDREKIFSIWRSMPAPASVTSLAAAISQTPAADVAEVRWSPVIGFEGKYDISTLGQVRNNKGAILKPTLKRTTGTVYKVVRLWKEGQYHTK